MNTFWSSTSTNIGSLENVPVAILAFQRVNVAMRSSVYKRPDMNRQAVAASNSVNRFKT